MANGPILMEGFHISDTINDQYIGTRLHDGKHVAILTTHTPAFTAEMLFRNFLYSRHCPSAYVIQPLEMKKGPVLIMERFGTPLREHFRAEDLSIDEIIDIAIQTTICLDKIHDYVLFHGNISPDSIFYDADTRQVKISNFFFDANYVESVFNQQSESMVNSVFSAPEFQHKQTHSEHFTVDQRVDQYSIAMSILYLLVGAQKFSQEIIGLGDENDEENEDEDEDENDETADVVDIDYFRPHKNIAKRIENLVHSIDEKYHCLRNILSIMLDPTPSNRYVSENALVGDLMRCKAGPTGTFELSNRVKDHRIRKTGMLFGREREIGQISRILADEAKEYGSKYKFILFEGVSGVGKSSLLNVVLNQCQSDYIASTCKFEKFDSNREMLDHSIHSRLGLSSVDIKLQRLSDTRSLSYAFSMLCSSCFSFAESKSISMSWIRVLQELEEKYGAKVMKRIIHDWNDLDLDKGIGGREAPSGDDRDMDGDGDENENDNESEDQNENMGDIEDLLDVQIDFLTTCVKFAFMNSKQGVVLVMDDFQYADENVFKLVNALKQTPIDNLVVVVSRRSDIDIDFELDADLKLTNANGIDVPVDTYERSESKKHLPHSSTATSSRNLHIFKFLIESIDLDAVRMWINQLLDVDPIPMHPDGGSGSESESDTLNELAELIHEKSLGNPLVIKILIDYMLHTMKDNLDFDESSSKWNIDVNEFKDAISSYHDVLFLKMQGISKKQMRLLEIGACLGSKFSLEDITRTITCIDQRKVPFVSKDLQASVFGPLISSLASDSGSCSGSDGSDCEDEKLNLLDTLMSTDILVPVSRLGFCFWHDNLRFGILKNMSQALISRIHLIIGCIFLDVSVKLSLAADHFILAGVDIISSEFESEYDKCDPGSQEYIEVLYRYQSLLREIILLFDAVNCQSMRSISFAQSKLYGQYGILFLMKLDEFCTRYELPDSHSVKYKYDFNSLSFQCHLHYAESLIVCGEYDNAHKILIDLPGFRGQRGDAVVSPPPPPSPSPSPTPAGISESTMTISTNQQLEALNTLHYLDMVTANQHNMKLRSEKALALLGVQIPLLESIDSECVVLMSSLEKYIVEDGALWGALDWNTSNENDGRNRSHSDRQHHNTILTWLGHYSLGCFLDAVGNRAHLKWSVLLALSKIVEEHVFVGQIPLIFAFAGIIFVLDRPDTAQRFADLARASLDDPSIKQHVSHLTMVATMHLVLVLVESLLQPHLTRLRNFKKLIAASERSRGSSSLSLSVWRSWVEIHNIICMLSCGIELGIVMNRVRCHSVEMAKYAAGSYDVLFMPSIYSLLRHLMGKTNSVATLSWKQFDEDKYMEKFSGNNKLMLYFVHAKLCSLFWAGACSLSELRSVALVWVDKFVFDDGYIFDEGELNEIPAHYGCFYSAMILFSEACDKHDGNGKDLHHQSISEKCTRIMNWFEKWSKQTPSFLHLYLLLKSQQLRLNGEFEECSKTLESAAEIALQHGMHQYVAFAYDSLGWLYLNKHCSSTSTSLASSVHLYAAETCFRKAIGLYKSIGMAVRLRTLQTSLSQLKGVSFCNDISSAFSPSPSSPSPSPAAPSTGKMSLSSKSNSNYTKTASLPSESEVSVSMSTTSTTTNQDQDVPNENINSSDLELSKHFISFIRDDFCTIGVRLCDNRLMKETAIRILETEFIPSLGIDVDTEDKWSVIHNVDWKGWLLERWPEKAMSIMTGINVLFENEQVQNMIGSNIQLMNLVMTRKENMQEMVDYIHHVICSEDHRLFVSEHIAVNEDSRSYRVLNWQIKDMVMSVFVDLTKEHSMLSHLKKDVEDRTRDLEMSHQKKVDALRHSEQVQRKIAEDGIKIERVHMQFTNTLCHELRNPLNGIVANIELLEREDHDHGYDHGGIEDLKMSAAHLRVIVDDVLDYSRLSSDEALIRLDYKPYSPLELLKRSIAMFQSAATLRKIKIIENVDPIIDERFYIKGDFNRILQCLTNLLSNAIKFTPDDGKGEITVSMKVSSFNDKKRSKSKSKGKGNSKKYEDSESETDGLVISVRDNGIGMSEYALENIFQPYRCSRKSLDSVFGGSGLGLVISNKLVQRMGGRMTVSSKQGEGCEFVIFLKYEKPSELEQANVSSSTTPTPSPATPVSTPVVGDDHSHSHSGNATDVGMVEGASASASEREAVDFSVMKVLLVDDVLINRRVISRILSKTGFFGDNISLAVNGQEAYDVYVEHNGEFDVVLMDIEMPVMDGYEATSKIREWESKNMNVDGNSKMKMMKKTPIVAISGYTSAEHRAKALDIGFSNYLTKPVELNVLHDLLLDLFLERDRKK